MSRGIPKEQVLSELDALLARDNYIEAKRHLLYWLAEAEDARDDEGLLLIYNELMGLCRKLGDRDRAVFYAKSALAQVKKMDIEDNVGAATTYLNSATVYKAFGKAEEGIALFRKAKKIYEQHLEKTDDRLAGLYNNMALALVDIKEFSEADELYRKALSVLEGIGKLPEQAITYLNMASAAEAQHGLERAAEIISHLAEKAEELLESEKDRTDGNYAFVCEKCASVFGYYGYFAYENKLKERSKRIYEGT